MYFSNIVKQKKNLYLKRESQICLHNANLKEEKFYLQEKKLYIEFQCNCSFLVICQNVTT